MLSRAPGLVGLVVAALLASACTGDGEVQQPSPPSATTSTPTARATVVPNPEGRGGSLRYALGADPFSLDPAYADDEEAQLVVDALFDSLTSLDRQLRPVPSAAQSWTVSPDQRTWTFRLQPGATFHDGTPVTADDFVRTFRRLTDGTASPRPFLAYQLADVVGFAEAQADGTPLAGVTATDEGLLSIELARPDADFASVLSHPTLGPIPAIAEESAFTFGQQPVGNGPFRMAEPWAHDQFIRVTRARETARLDEVLFRIYSDDPGQEQAYADFVQGQLHVARVPAAQRRDALATFGAVGDGASGPGVLEGPWATTLHYGFNLTKPPFDQVEVRRAVSMLVDRETLALDVLLGTRRPADRLLPPGVVGSTPASCPWCVHDPEGALALLAEAEIVLDPEAIGPIDLLHLRGQSDQAIAQHLADAITEHLGLEVTLRELGLTAYAPAIREGAGHLHRAGWTADHAMPAAFLTPLFHSRNVGGDNHTGFSDPEVDALLDEAAATAGQRERLALYAAAEARIVELAPTIPLFTYELGRIVADNVEGFRMDALARVDLSLVALRP